MAERWWRTERGRTWLKEVGNIVLGVLIALALGAVANEIGWRIEVFKARRALAEEMGEIVGQARERERTDACIEHRLDAIGQILDTAARTGRLPPTGRIGSPMHRSWSRGVWDSTLGAEIASHFDREMLDNLSGAYEFVDFINRRTEQELGAWTRLYAVVGPGRSITAGEIAELRSALAEARTAHRYILLGGIRLDQVVQAFELPLDQEPIRDYQGLQPSPLCGPIEAPNGRPYGEAPGRGMAQRLRANPITRDSIGVPRR